VPVPLLEDPVLPAVPESVAEPLPLPLPPVPVEPMPELPDVPLEAMPEPGEVLPLDVPEGLPVVPEPTPEVVLRELLESDAARSRLQPPAAMRAVARIA
jgi:hypothetical protein